MKYTTSALALAGMAVTVRGHGFLTSPQARMPGDAFQAACGQQVYYNQAGDNYGNVQGELQVAATQSDYDAAACDIWLCKGFKYADNTDNVQSYTAGQTVDIKFDVRAPHTGVANVSIVDTATNTVIGSPLASWDVFASNSASIPANQTSFSITIPSDLGDKCSTAGACVIQHFWDAADINQTYESCIDFTVGGSGSSSSGSSSAASSVASSSAVATSSAASSSAASITTQAAVVTSSAAASSSVEVASSSAVASSAAASSAVASSAVASSSAVAPVAASSSAACGTAETVTATITQTVTALQTVTAGSSSAFSGINTQVAVVSSSSSCTTTMTIKKSSSASASVPTFFPYGNATENAAPTAASTGFVTGYAAPTGTGSPAQALTSVIAELNTALPSSVLTAQATATAAATSTGTSTPSKSLPSGFSLKDILDWVAYLLSKTIIDAEHAGTREHARDVKRAI